jgi:hypothetical protein
MSNRDHLFLAFKKILHFFFNIFFLFCCRINTYVFISNGDHSSNFFRQTSLLFHKWLAERFNLDDAWIVNVGYKDTSIYNALIIWIGKFCKLIHKQNCSHDFFYFINHNIIVQVTEETACFFYISYDYPQHIVGVFVQSRAWYSVFSVAEHAI